MAEQQQLLVRCWLQSFCSIPFILVVLYKSEGRKDPGYIQAVFNAIGALKITVLTCPLIQLPEHFPADKMNQRSG